MFIKLLLQSVFGSRLGTVLFIVAATGLLVHLLRNYIRQVILAFKLRGPKALPIIGNVLTVGNKSLMIEEARKGFEKYGSIVRVWITILPGFFILDPEHIQLVLSSKKHTEKLFVYRFMHNFLGKGLITSSREKWGHHRKLIQPSFHLSILEQFVASFADGANAFSDRIGQRCNIPMNITELVNDCIMDILNETVFGVPIKDRGIKREKENSPYRQGTILLPYRLTKPWLMLDWLYHLTEAATKELKQKSKLDDFTRNMVSRRRKQLQSGTTKQQCLVDFMLKISEKCPEFTEDDIINEANTFMLAGQDSVGASVAFTLTLLANHKEYQEKCMRELDSIFTDGGAAGDKRTPTMADLREMKYLEQCIKESLRLYPSVPILARTISEDIQMGNRVLPTGSTALLNVFATHRLPHYYPEPEKFDPERFSPENCEKRHPYAFIPFSAGPRNCIGYRYALIEMKTIISTILRNYTLHSVPGKEEIKSSFRITLRAHGGLWVKFQKRFEGTAVEGNISEPAATQVK